MPSNSRDHALHPLLQQQKRVTANWCPWAHATRSGSNRSLAGISSITKATPSKTRWFIYSWNNSNKTKSKHTHRESKTGISNMIVWKMCVLFQFAKFQGALYIFCKCKHDLANGWETSQWNTTNTPRPITMYFGKHEFLRYFVGWMPLQSPPFEGYSQPAMNGRDEICGALRLNLAVESFQHPCKSSRRFKPKSPLIKKDHYNHNIFSVFFSVQDHWVYYSRLVLSGTQLVIKKQSNRTKGS